MRAVLSFSPREDSILLTYLLPPFFRYQRPPERDVTSQAVALSLLLAKKNEKKASREEIDCSCARFALDSGSCTTYIDIYPLSRVMSHAKRVSRLCVHTED